MIIFFLGFVEEWKLDNLRTEACPGEKWQCDKGNWQVEQYLKKLTWTSFLIFLNSYISEYESLGLNETPNYDFLGHPINAYLFVRHVAHGWHRIHTAVTESPNSNDTKEFSKYSSSTSKYNRITFMQTWENLGFFHRANNRQSEWKVALNDRCRWSRVWNCQTLLFVQVRFYLIY